MLHEATTGNRQLSFPDRLAVIVCREHGFVCVSNDRQVQLECERQHVPVLWGLELLVRLVEQKGISAARARALGTTMCTTNAWLGSKVLQRFLARLEKA